jgi:protein phosphatase methylesterase 1
MGGGVVVRACPRLLELKYRVSSVAVLDVVEGAFAHPHSLKDIA